jgi:hypothetical protein
MMIGIHLLTWPIFFVECKCFTVSIGVNWLWIGKYRRINQWSWNIFFEMLNRSCLKKYICTLCRITISIDLVGYKTSNTIICGLPIPSSPIFCHIRVTLCRLDRWLPYEKSYFSFSFLYPVLFSFSLASFFFFLYQMIDVTTKRDEC